MGWGFKYQVHESEFSKQRQSRIFLGHGQTILCLSAYSTSSHVPPQGYSQAWVWLQEEWYSETLQPKT